MKTLVLPDLHQPQLDAIDAIERLIADQKADQVVFLGDYFDCWNDSPMDARRTAEWLVESLKDPRRLHLVGNHDASYLWAPAVSTMATRLRFAAGQTFCPGFTWEKEAMVREVLGTDARDRFAFHAWVGDWLLTHAGLSARWLPPDGFGSVAGSAEEMARLKAWLVSEEIAARQAFARNRTHWFAVVGNMRGGERGSGGILWCDHRELLVPPGVKQLYGHTPHKLARVSENLVCIDTNLGDGTGPRHYAIIEDRLSVHQLYP